MASVTFIYMVFIATVQQQCCHSYKLIVCELESGSVVCVCVCVLYMSRRHLAPEIIMSSFH